MSRNAIEKTLENDYDAISYYYASNESDKLTQAQQLILDRWRSADEILRKYPRKKIAVRKLMARYPELSERQAYVDLENACKFWNLNAPVDREFLNRWAVDKLITEISNKYSPPEARSRNLATLFKYLEKLPEISIDPKHMEKNNVYIQINLNNQTINIKEEELMLLPKTLRESVLGMLYDKNEITEAEAAEIIQS